ncbi:MAG: DMT family transporter [Bacteroidota bacterium]
MSYAKPSATSNLLLITAACIWGFAFVAQKQGSELLDVFTFNAIRFGLGTLVLLPLVFWIRKKEGVQNMNLLWKAGIVCGVYLFGGAYFQQLGVSFTTAGNAGFITGLYVLIVPAAGLFIGKSSGLSLWLGAILAVVGLYLLSVKEGFQISKGDIFVLLGAFVWAGHVLAVSHYAPKLNAFLLASVQFGVCSVLSIFGMLLFESPSLSNITQSNIPLLYCGILSVGGAFTLQVIAQKKVHPAIASILLSLESVFAALGGWWILNEKMSLKELLGCAIMLAGIIVAQLNIPTFKTQKLLL